MNVLGRSSVLREYMKHALIILVVVGEENKVKKSSSPELRILAQCVAHWQ